MNTKLAAAIGLFFALIASGQAQTNSWIKTTNGFWEVTTSWSLGTPPTSSQSATFLTNANSKIASVDNMDAIVYAQTLSVSNLVVSAPLGSTNSLALTNINLGLSLTFFQILNTLSISSGGSLLIYNSKLRLDNVATNTQFMDGFVKVDGEGSILATNHNLDMIFGNVGHGSLIVNSGTTVFDNLFLAFQPGSAGTLTFAGGTNIVNGLLFAGINLSDATGTVWVTGGQLSVHNSLVIGGPSGIGQMSISNGAWFATDVYIPYPGPGPRGILTIAGGTATISSNLFIGTSLCDGAGSLVMSGGGLYVTNSTHTAVLEVEGGTLTISGGTLRADKIVITNACAHFIRTGGTVTYGSVVLNPNDDTDGDGILNGYEQSHGLDPLNPVDSSVDKDGDGLSNLQEYLAGTDPSNNASAFRITSILRTNNDIRITWMMGSGKTNALQVTTGAGDGSYATNSFASLFTVTNTVGTTTNYLDIGGATNSPARYYRVRLVP